MNRYQEFARAINWVVIACAGVLAVQSIFLMFTANTVKDVFIRLFVFCVATLYAVIRWRAIRIEDGVQSSSMEWPEIKTVGETDKSKLRPVQEVLLRPPKFPELK